MGESTLVKADKQLVKQAHELGANVRRIVDLVLEDYIKRNLVLKPEIKARKRPSRDCNGGSVKVGEGKTKSNGKNLDVDRPTLTSRACSSVVGRRLCKPKVPGLSSGRSTFFRKKGFCN